MAKGPKHANREGAQGHQQQPVEMGLGADVVVWDQGTVVLFTLETDEARAWVEENVQLEGWQWMGGRGFAVDHRFAGDLAEGMQAAGLVLQ